MLLQNKTARSPVLSISNTHLPTLLAIRETYGGSVLNKRTYGPHRRPAFHWFVTGKTCIAVLNRLLPHLHEKRQQAEVLILAHSLPKGSDCTHLKAYLKELKRPEFVLENNLLKVKSNEATHCTHRR